MIFNLILTVNFYRSQKKLAFKAVIIISFKYISNNFAVVFDTQDNIQNR